MRLTVALAAAILLLTPALALAQEDEADRCEPRKSGEQCGEGNGRQTPGGGDTGNGRGHGPSPASVGNT